jgi:gluconokinase
LNTEDSSTHSAADAKVSLPSSIKALRLVVMGVSGCGKSEIGHRLARWLGTDYVEGDAFHPVENVAKMSAGFPLDDEDRFGWLTTLANKIDAARQHRQGLVLSCSSLKRRYRDLLRAGDPQLVFIHLHGDRETIAARMQSRPGHFMPPALLDSQLRDLELLQPDEKGFQIDIRYSPDELIAQIARQCEQICKASKNDEEMK